MTMRKLAGSVLFTAAAAAAVVGMSIAPALAATTHLTVRVSGGGSYTAKAGKTVLTDNGISVTCTSSKGSGKLPNGTHRGAAPVKLGSVARLSFSNCSGILGTVTTHVQSKPSLNADSKTNRKGQTDAIISGVKVNVSTTGCSFTVTGSAPGFYTNKTHTLTMTPKLPVKPIKKAQLTISGVAPGTCGGLVKNGDHPTYKATYKVSLRRLKITSR
jgi:hypothetical protein